MTHINYAFGNVVGGKCVLGDVEADTSKFYDAASSVDGTTDSWDAGAKSRNLGGVFFWELSGDTTNGELITAVKNNVG